MKKEFTEVEKNLIQAICTLYSIQIFSYTDSIFTGALPKRTRVTLNGMYLLQLLNTTNVVYIELKTGINVLTIIAQ